MNTLPHTEHPHDWSGGDHEGDMVERAALRLGVGTPGPRTGEVALVSTIRLKVMEVTTFERNPRRASPDRIAELKESIRINGIEQIVTVTRRPSESRYVVAKGGNSRLTAAQSLYSEAQDPRFLYRDFLYIPYPGEAKLLAAHLRENEQRADLCFWDKAVGYLALKADLEQERGVTLSLREFARLLAEDGAPVSHVLLSLFQFATQRLASLGSATMLLSRRNVVDVIQPAIGALARLARRFEHDDDWLLREVVNVALERFGSGLDPGASSVSTRERVLDTDALVESLQRHCSDALGIPENAVKPLLALLSREPEISPQQLREAAAQTASGVVPMTKPARRPSLEPAVRAVESAQEVSDATRSAEDDVKPSSTFAQDEAGRLATARASDDAESAHRRGKDEALPAPDTVLSAVEATGKIVARDDLADLHRDVRAFATLCGLENTLRDAPELPYGFMVDLPDPEQTDPPLDTQARQHETGYRRYVGWWWLVNLSRQNTPCGLTHLPSGTRFGEITGGEERWSDACDTHIGEPLLADRFDLFFDTALNPGSEIGGRYLELVGIARGFRARHPTRFMPPRWTELDADALLRRGERR